MPNTSKVTKKILDRMMNLKEFTLSVPVEDNWLPNGRVPFDIKIKNGMATVTIPALNEDEARDRLIAYFNSSEEEE